MRGMAETILGSVVILLATLILIFSLYSQEELRGAEISKGVYQRILDEEARLSVISLFNTKVPEAEKPYLETMVDAALNINPTKKSFERYKVFYGIGVGELDTREIIPPFFDNLMPGRWKLVLLIPNSTEGQENYIEVSYGNLSVEPKYVYKQIIPLPEEQIGKIIFYIG